MAPEQFDGREVAFRTDVYALGLVLYELFTGKRPFPAVALGDLIAMRRESAPRAPSRVSPELEPFVERTILDCLAKDPDDRPASGQAVAEALSSGQAAAESWRPAPRLNLPQRPHWRMERKLGAGGFGEGTRQPGGASGAAGVGVSGRALRRRGPQPYPRSGDDRAGDSRARRREDRK